MKRLFRFIKTFRGKKDSEIILQVDNMANKFADHPELTDLPYTKAEILDKNGKYKENYNKHLLGDHAATQDMYYFKEIVSTYNFETVDYIEEVCNDLGSANIGLALGLKLYGEPASKDPKTLTIVDGDHEGDAIATFPKDKDAYSYIAEAAIVDGETTGEYKFAGASGITKMFLHNLKPGTKYLVRITSIYTNDLGAPGTPKEFRPKG